MVVQFPYRNYKKKYLIELFPYGNCRNYFWQTNFRKIITGKNSWLSIVPWYEASSFFGALKV
ncbi:MAG: hypothetical protein CVU09_15735 [Bacteroidetes bacterium HGW-Bacteroidetes-4]|nr:MAG: hypothetical protein CVU09_15735 [Bacteroidetes bacterium HGW-Bacteroidetes-4]